MKNTVKLSWVVFLILITALSISCKKKTTTPAVIASFTYQVDASDFKKVTFTSTSSDYSTLAWDFGDGQTSTVVNPVHTYAAVGVFTVKLTATNSGGTSDSYSTSVTISDPNAELTKLVGDVSKTWKLLRSTATGRYPLECGPFDHSTIWWAVGKDNDEMAKRPCMLNDEWTFGRDGSLVFDAKGDYWSESGIFADPVNVCASTTTMVGAAPGNADLSAWGNGTHTFKMTAGTAPTITAIGKGAFIGFFKLGNGAETKVCLDSVRYHIIKLTDGAVDTLIVEGQYQWDATPGGYWRFVLVHYDDPSQEPPIPGNKPNAGFTTAQNGTVVTFTNTTTGGDTYLWDFGDGTTSTAANPVHTYAGGPFIVTLSATNTNGTATASSALFVSTADLTDALLQGASWKVYISDKSVFVGPGLGKSDWWSVSKVMLTTGTGGDDWTCMPDDEFQFSAGGGFAYKTNGSARNDGYMGAPNGCFSDAQIAASTLGAALGSCSTHTYAFTPAAGTTRPIIKLTNGAGFAAFIGFYKGYNGIASGIKGGENSGTDPVNFGSATNTYEVMGYAKNGTKEYLFVSVDISLTHDGSSAWSAILTR